MWKRVVTALPLLGTASALAACPIELAVYRDVDNVASIDFRPTGENAAVTNTFRLLIDGIVLDGIVMWTEAVPRPNGVLAYKCPSGDVTGQELDACTLWQGVIYASDEAGNVALLPAEGSTAPKSLILSDLAHSLRVSAAYDAAGFKRLPGDVFVLSGCQE